LKLTTEPYLEQVKRWPRSGRHILAQYDAESIVVYQAYRPAIGRFAAERGYFGGEFSLGRMSWIKPNFLWMMYRSGWGSKEGQEVVLAVRLLRSGFDTILSDAVHSTYVEGPYGSRQEWEQTVKRSEVRLQWDPDHDPSGHKLERRAIQLGLRGQVLARYAREWIVDIEDISDFVREQSRYTERAKREWLVTPREEVYPVTDKAVAVRLGLSSEHQP
jgi:hypothetical protein